MWRKIGTLIAATLVSTSALAVVSAPAEAASSYLCKGFSACEAKGLGSAGFSSVYNQKFWNMTGGHNCTNYVAYRLTHNGRITAHPKGMRGAATWKNAAKAAGIPVTKTPKVGDVAWWKSGSKGTVAKKGHVAYVEQVLSNGTIRISEDSLGGNFAWRTLTKGSYYPTAFIRFPQSDGTPTGKVTSIKKTSKGITIKGFASEPNGGGTQLLLSFNGPRGAVNTTSAMAGSFDGNFVMTRTWSGAKPKKVYVYALNRAGTPGADRLIGSGKTGW